MYIYFENSDCMSSVCHRNPDYKNRFRMLDYSESGMLNVLNYIREFFLHNVFLGDRSLYTKPLPSKNGITMVRNSENSRSTSSQRTNAVVAPIATTFA